MREKGEREEGGQTERDVRRNEEMTRYLLYRKPPFFSFRSDCTLVCQRKRTSVKIEKRGKIIIDKEKNKKNISDHEGVREKSRIKKFS